MLVREARAVGARRRESAGGEERRGREVSRLAHPLAAGMTFRVEDEERDSARNVPRLVNGFDTKKRIRSICL